MRKVQLTIKQEEVAPATTSDLVVMSHGKTLKEELSTNVLDKFSREVTVDTSISKVIDGTLDGAYESLVFKGKSLVNLGREIDSQYHNIYGEGTQITSDGYFKIPYAGSENNHSVRLRFGLLEPLIKPDTVYSLIVEIVENTTQNAHIGFTGHNNLSCVEPVDKNTNIASAVGTHVKLIKRRSEVTARQSDLYFCIWDKTDIDATKHIKFRYMILEGDWTNKEIPPFFTGIGYVKMPILHNVGKNLFDEDNSMELGAWKTDAKPFETSSEIRCKNNFTPFPNGLKNGDVMRIVLSDTSINSNTNMHVYDESKTRIVTLGYGTSPYIEGTDFINGVSTVTIHDVSKCKYFSFRAVSTNTECKFAIMVNTSAPYEDHKTNILYTSEEIVLREVGGVQDTYNPLTGEYVQRIGEVVLDGSTRYNGITIPSTLNNTVRYDINIQGIVQGAVMNDRLPNNVFANRLFDEEMVLTYTNQIQVRLAKTKLSNLDVPSFLEYLQQNPITVQYELAEPITTIVEPLTIPFAYENGYIILESGSEEQSLLPELKYSAPASKNGVISTTSKAILKHEQRLHKFEDLLLRESILMDYRLTLSFLDKM